MRLPAADRKRPTPLDGVVALLVAAAALALLMMLRPSGGEALTAVVTLDGVPLAEYRLDSLEEPVIQTLEQAPYPLTIQFQSDGVRILHSHCPSQDCVHTGWIRQAGQQIICLPNKLIISLTGTHAGEFDAVTGEKVPGHTTFF